MSNPISTRIDWSRDGLQHGHLKLPYSRDDSAWGSVMIPLTYVRNGSGPTALITGGNHGDEYEGPLAITDYASGANPDSISGAVILIPFMNMPAFAAGLRTSPIDAGNMNRSFPGNPNGSVTEKIADYFQTVLLPMADVVLDFHSGGKTLDFLPFAASHVLPDKEQETRCRLARDAFNAPWSIEMLEIDSNGMYDSAAEAQGKTFVTTELGGGGTARAETVSIAKKGLRNLLIHSGIQKGDLERDVTRHLHQPGDDCFVFAEERGMLEMLVDLGGLVVAGQVIARIWSIEHTGRPPIEICCGMDGLLVARHHPGLVQPGDCLAVFAQETSA